MPDLSERVFKRQWRHYKTPAGHAPVLDFIRAQTDVDAAEIAAEMYIVRRDGLSAARHLQGPIYEVRVEGFDKRFRILFAPVGFWKMFYLTLGAFKKETQETPTQEIRTAKHRLRDWETRGIARRLRDR